MARQLERRSSSRALRSSLRCKCAVADAPTYFVLATSPASLPQRPEHVPGAEGLLVDEVKQYRRYDHHKRQTADKVAAGQLKLPPIATRFGTVQ